MLSRRIKLYLCSKSYICLNWAHLNTVWQPCCSNMTSLPEFTHLATPHQGCTIWYPNWVRFAPNGTNLGLFKISFSTFWLAEPKSTETDLKKSQHVLKMVLKSPRFVTFGGQTVVKLILKRPRFVPFGANLNQFGDNPDTPGGLWDTGR